MSWSYSSPGTNQYEDVAYDLVWEVAIPASGAAAHNTTRTWDKSYFLTTGSFKQACLVINPADTQNRARYIPCSKVRLAEGRP